MEPLPTAPSIPRAPGHLWLPVPLQSPGGGWPWRARVGFAPAEWRRGWGFAHRCPRAGQGSRHPGRFSEYPQSQQKPISLKTSLIYSWLCWVLVAGQACL